VLKIKVSDVTVKLVSKMQHTLCSPVMASYILWHGYGHQIADAEDD
jgi:hypothetical protein